MPAIQHIAIEADAPVSVRVRHVPGGRHSPARMLQQVIRNNDNEDGTSRDYALEALTDKRAAFWVAREGSGRAPVICVMRTANAKGSLSLAIEIEVSEAERRVFPKRIMETLNLLIPLNGFATVQLMDAYAEQGTFRDRDELERRRHRVAPNAREFA